MNNATQTAPESLQVHDGHRTLGLWPMRRTLATAFAMAAILSAAAWFVVSWLLGSPPQAPPQPLDLPAQLGRLALVFALVGGVGALVALVTAYRRQRVDEAAGERAERIHAHTEHDATERRATELYGQAVEHLGHDKAAVRLAGLYSLERLARDHPQHRQTVVDVLCAYLRMPFQPPPASADDRQPPPEGRADNAADNAPAAGGPDHHSDSRQELQVRLTAQRLLTCHLVLPTAQDAADQSSPVPQTYWDGMQIDLRGAHLVDFDFSHCRPHHTDFRKARFSGDARFNETQFSGRIRFEQAEFGQDAWFTGAAFSRDAQFGQAAFHGVARFDGAAFSRAAQFTQAAFSQDTWFDKTAFRGTAAFDGARFSANVDFTNATASYPNKRHIWPAPWDARPPSADAKTAQLVRPQ